MQNYDLFETIANATRPQPEKYDTKPIGDVMVRAIDRLNRLKYRPTRPNYPKELSGILVKADFDRNRIVLADEDLGDSYCRICVEDKENPYEHEDDGRYAWVDVPVEWFEDATADYMKEVGIWGEFNPEEQYIISDWLQSYLHEWERKDIVSGVFSRVLDDIFRNIETLPL